MTQQLKQQAKVQTNATKGSVCKITVEVVKFEDLWRHYPNKPPYVDPKTGHPPQGFSNQCAIKVSVAIHGSGIEMKSFNAAAMGINPKEFGRVSINGKNTATLAAQLAKWLNKQPFCGLPQQPEAVTGKDWEKKIKSRAGIVYFADYWMRSSDNKGNPTGDHIDLWNGSRLTASGLLGTLTTTARFLGQRSFLPGTNWGYSDLGTSKSILFWEIK